MRLAIVVAVGVLFGGLGFSNVADATDGVCSATTLAPGQTLVVTGEATPIGGPGSNITLRLEGTLIGATHADGIGNFVVSGPIPLGALPGNYDVLFRVDGIGPFFACSIFIVPAAATPTPTATATARPARAPRARRARAPAPQQQQQQQQQQQLIVPANLVVPHHRACCFSGGSKLPTTGVDAGEVGGVGAASLAVGVSLMELARRRRRNWFEPSSTSHRLPTIDWVPRPHVPASEEIPATGAEVDLLLPYWVGEPVTPRFEDSDPIRPSF